MDKTNLQVIRESFGRVCYSHKTHEKDAEIQIGHSIIVKWINIVLISITTGSLLSTIFANKNLIFVGAIFSSITLGFSIFQISFDPEKKATKHKQVANSLWLIREKYINLMADIINSQIKKDEIVKKRDNLINELDLIYKSAPSTSSVAYEKARSALRLNEELTFNNQEINQLLPDSLHIANKKKK